MQVDGLSFLDSAIWLGPSDWADILKMGVGSAILPALLKLQREVASKE